MCLPKEFKRNGPTFLIGLVMLSLAGVSRADERESLESLRQTTLGLVEALVESGVLTREKADALIKKARDKNVSVIGNSDLDQVKKTDARTVRIPYVPETVKNQIRNELKEEIVSQARVERWGVPNSLPEWLDRIKVDGDFRLRWQHDQFSSGNPSPSDFVTGVLATGLTRAPDLSASVLGGASKNIVIPTANTEDAKDRLRVRARLNISAKVSDMVSTGLRLATGSATDRVSTNQTLGQNFNKYQLSVDRAYMKLDPIDWFNISGGRIPNPWFSSDLMWSENLNFEGVAAAAKWPSEENARFLPFAVLGAFPIREQAPPKKGRWLYGAQIGSQWHLAPTMRVKFGLAKYVYKNLEGRPDPDYDAKQFFAGSSYGQYEYEQGLRQRGNTLFITNNLAEIQNGLAPSDYKWGLASKFHPLVLTVAGEYSRFYPVVLGLSAEYVNNTAFDRREISERIGINYPQGLGLEGGRKDGFQVRLVLGAQEVRQVGDWQTSLTYRWLGSDAVVDAFTDGDFGLGGTNNKGYILAASYGIDKNTALTVKYLTSKSIDSPTVQFSLKDRFSVNSLQVDLNVRY